MRSEEARGERYSNNCKMLRTISATEQDQKWTGHRWFSQSAMALLLVYEGRFARMRLWRFHFYPPGYRECREMHLEVDFCWLLVSQFLTRYAKEVVLLSSGTLYFSFCTHISPPLILGKVVWGHKHNLKNLPKLRSWKCVQLLWRLDLTDVKFMRYKMWKYSVCCCSLIVLCRRLFTTHLF